MIDRCIYYNLFTTIKSWITKLFTNQYKNQERVDKNIKIGIWNIGLK